MCSPCDKGIYWRHSFSCARMPSHSRPQLRHRGLRDLATSLSTTHRHMQATVVKPFISLMKPRNSFLKPVQLQLKSPRPLFWASFAFASLQALQASAFECHREPASRWLRSWASQLFTWPADLDRGGLVDFAWLPGAPFQTLCPAAATGLEIFQGRPFDCGGRNFCRSRCRSSSRRPRGR